MPDARHYLIKGDIGPETGLRKGCAPIRSLHDLLKELGYDYYSRPYHNNIPLALAETDENGRLYEDTTEEIVYSGRLLVFLTTRPPLSSDEINRIKELNSLHVYEIREL
ncbi:MAG: hypothetical protein HZB67_03665 [Candidatus Aenigmarchaeota archaeon]|nr:hypothetical protein [Candidatus Aenigmarchaeota archaeon]